MKTWKKIVLGSAAGLTVAGLLLTGIGYVTGGAAAIQAQAEEEKNQIFTTEELPDFNKIVLKNKSEFGQTATAGYSIRIKTTTDDAPSIQFDSNQKRNVNYAVENGVLTIETENRTHGSDVTVNFFSVSDLISLVQTGEFNEDNYGEIVISIPEGTSLQQLSGSISVGDIVLDGITLDQIDLEANVGDIDLYQTTIKKGNIQLDAGDIYTENATLSNLTTSLSAGDVDIESGTLDSTSFELEFGDFSAYGVTYLGENDLALSMGDVDIELDNYDLAVTTDNDLGDTDVTDELDNTSKNILSITADTADIVVQ